MEIRKAKDADFGAMTALFDEARGTIATLGINQWQNGEPSAAVVREDISLGQSYVIMEGDALCGTFALMNGSEPLYDVIENGDWKTGTENKNYQAIHRVAVAVSMRGRGISTAIINFAAERARELGRVSLRIDTHEGNIVMRRMLEKHGFELCGVIYLKNGDPRVAYERIL